MVIRWFEGGRGGNGPSSPPHHVNSMLTLRLLRRLSPTVELCLSHVQNRSSPITNLLQKCVHYARGFGEIRIHEENFWRFYLQRAAHCLAGVKPSEGQLDLSEVLGSGKRHDCVDVEANEPLYVLHTSGTTGKEGAVGDTTLTVQFQSQERASSPSMCLCPLEYRE